MQLFNKKPSATALNETALILAEKKTMTSRHFNKMIDASVTEFQYCHDAPRTGKTVSKEDYEKLYTFKLDKGRTAHYKPGFWQIDKKLAMFFERHKTLAVFLDWFNFRAKTAYEIGFLYLTDESREPQKATRPTHDYAGEIWNVRHNSSWEADMTDWDNELRSTQRNYTNIALVIGAIVLVVVFALVAYNFMGANHAQQAVENVTNPTFTPMPTFNHFGAP